MADFSKIILFLYFIVWCLTLIRYQKKKKIFDVGSLMISTFLLFAFSSFMVYGNVAWGEEFKEVRIFPFIYLYGMLILSMYPVLRINENKINVIQKPTSLILSGFIYLYIAASLISIPELISKVGDLKMLVIDSAFGLDSYNESITLSQDSGKGGVSNLPAIISGAFSNVGVLFFFYYLTLDNRKKIVSIALGVCTLSVILASLLRGERGGVYYQSMTIIATYLLLRKFIPHSINTNIKKIGVLLGVIIFGLIASLTLSRFGSGSNSDPIGSIYYYIGSQNINFNNYGLDNNGIRYGDRTFPFFKMLLGCDDVPHNFWERREKYPHLHVNDETFISYVGDFTLDFGPIVAFVIFLLFFVFSYNRTIIRNGKMKFYQLILIHFIICVCVQGGLSLYSFSDIGGNLKLIVTYALYVIFKLDYARQQRVSLKYSTHKIDFDAQQ